MDPLTHGLLGATIGRLGFRGRASMWTLIAASMLPDIDYITRLFGAEVFLRYHRGITHGVLALFLVPVLAGIAVGRRRKFYYFFTLAFIGYASHIALDLTNHYGTRVLSPLDGQAYSLGLFFVVEPLLLGGLLLGLAAVWLNGSKARQIAVASLVFVVALAAAKFYLQRQVTEFVKARLDDHIVCQMSPLPNDFSRWWFVARKGSVIKAGYADLFTNGIYIYRSYPPQPHDPAVEMSKGTEAVRSFLAFSKYPYAEVTREGERVEVKWRELSYSYAQGDHFVARVIMDGRGKILGSSFRF